MGGSLVSRPPIRALRFALCAGDGANSWGMPATTPIRTLLVANRGEIALRIMRTAREMGMRTVAVASEPDLGAPHALFADVCVPIGEGPPSASYLDIGKIVAAAKETGADAVHPGYGFLSERAELADALAEVGLVFVGPPAGAMSALGGKISAKAIAVGAGVPVVPGHFEPGASDADLKAAAEGIGYPVMLKASAGGGGRGMRVVRAAGEFDAEIARARDEAVKAFGDGAMMVEKLVANPRHIEVQAIADAHGGVRCLFERDCSVQRRHQKLVEEAPSPFVDEALWSEMREASERLLRASGYVGAGTVEFIVDPATRAFYFLEVNARLQVEHPTTEAITGLDLVRLQLMVAQGEPLPPFDAARDRISGWAMEARLIAEDPARGFLPSVGDLRVFRMPALPNVRVDSGYVEGGAVSPYYDSLLAKLVAHGPDRDSARKRLIAALRETHVLGVRTNAALLIAALEDETFASGVFDTGFLPARLGDWTPPAPPPELAAIADALGGSAPSTERPEASSPWAIRDGFRNVRV